MRRFLYIGINSRGTTSAMRAEKLRNILSDWEFSIIDTDIPKRSMNRIWQSIGFRYKRGPLINKVNNYVKDNVNGHYDMIWVDKAIYITPATTKMLRGMATKLIHFTPDPAFTFHRSKHFFGSAPMYDKLITTKSYELDSYNEVAEGRVIYATQGFDRAIHKPLCDFGDKSGLCFIGHYEDDREEILLALIRNKIKVKLAGIHWDNFAKKNSCEYLDYLGTGVYGDDYVKTIGSSYFALGSISKWVPEKHTTRTFEIPACKTALITEYNEEIASFYDDREVIFYNDADELVEKVQYYLSNKESLESLIEAEYRKVMTGGFDYESILRSIISQIYE
ncbi:MAG: glycosyltransferase [Rikenellaceae bacterium]